MILNPDDKHVACFAELNTAIECLTDRPIILNAHCCAPLSLPPGIIYNLENVPLQVDMKGYRGLERTIWDFSEENIRDYPVGLSVEHVPVGYHQTMTRFEMRPERERDIDVLFYGAKSARRAAIYNALRAKGFRVEVCTEYGAVRDEMLSRSKCVTVIPYLASFVFPVLRAAHLVANQVPIVAEDGIDVPAWVGRTCAHEHLVNRIVKVIANGDPETAYRFRAFCSQPMMLPL